MDVQVDAYICDGCGQCEEICPEVFAVCEGSARVKRTRITEALEDSCRRAADDCPAQAIVIEE